jgi:hypothetical protein
MLFFLQPIKAAMRYVNETPTLPPKKYLSCKYPGLNKCSNTLHVNTQENYLASFALWGYSPPGLGAGSTSSNRQILLWPDTGDFYYVATIVKTVGY